MTFLVPTATLRLVGHAPTVIVRPATPSEIAAADRARWIKSILDQRKAEGKNLVRPRNYLGNAAWELD